MTFEPLIRSNEWLLILQVGLGASLSAVIIYFLACWFLHSRRGNNATLSKEGRSDKASYAGFCAFILGGIFIFFGIHEHQVQQNMEIVASNVTQKYMVEDITFAPRGRGLPSYSPEQPDPQPITIKVSGKSRLATLTQDEKTSEPTLLDVDTHEPMSDILRK